MSDNGSPQHHTIVVGVDGSEPSKDALRWAARQAELTGAELRVVMSWELPAISYWAVMPQEWDIEEATRQAVEETVSETLGDSPAIQPSVVVVRGSAAPVLLAQARDADLLVVGSRGHGGFTGMLIGSVSEHCVSHAHCPVVVVRHPHHRSHEGHGEQEQTGSAPTREERGT
jgi:nucleotide-binding universal stress UspA family protein